MSPAEGVSPEATAGGLTIGAKGIPEATVARLPGYLRALNHLSDNGVATVSSGDLADEAGVNPAQLRKDLSHLGSYGTRGVGYSVEYLRFQIGREIGSTVDWPVIIIGVGNLGTALAKNADFGSRGFRVVALVDTSSDLVGTELDGLMIEHQDDLTRTVRESGARIAVITTPPDSAQAVCDELVSCGVTSILNFAATVLTAPDDVTVRKVDLGQELQILAYHEQRKLDGSWPAEMADGAWTPPVHDQARLAGSTTISVPEREAP